MLIFVILFVAMVGIIVPSTFATPCMTAYYYSENFVDGKIPNCTPSEGTNFSNQDLKYADFSYRNLSGANFTGADLSYADLTGADLTGADLSNANLFRAKLYQADLSNANLENTNLKGASLPDKAPTINEVSSAKGNSKIILSSEKLTVNSNGFAGVGILQGGFKSSPIYPKIPNYEPIEPSASNWNRAVVPNYEPIEPSASNWNRAVVPNYVSPSEFKLDTSHSSEFRELINKVKSAPPITMPKFMDSQFAQSNNIRDMSPSQPYNYGKDTFLSEKYPSIGNIPSHLRPWN
jgi:hypothetical protein